MGFTDFFMKMNLATGGKNPNDAMADALRNIGLQLVRQDGAYGEYGGWFNGRQAGMAVDGSALMNASNAAYGRAASLGVASAFGLVSQGYTDHATNMADMRARSSMQSAQMLVRWWLTAARPAASGLSIRRDAAQGHHPLGPGLFGAMDGALWNVVGQPHVLTAINGAPFHGIEVAQYNLIATWQPPMSEYQQVAASPDNYARAAWSALNALSLLADAVCGR